MSTLVRHLPAPASLKVIVTLFGRASGGTGNLVTSTPQLPSKGDAAKAGVDRQIAASVRTIVFMQTPLLDADYRRCAGSEACVGRRWRQRGRSGRPPRGTPCRRSLG